MNRNIRKLIAEYDNTFIEKNNIRGAVYYSDMQQIKESSPTLYDAIYNAIRAGIMIGYKTGKKEAMQKIKNEPVDNRH